jgi:hypothetical protein
LNEFGWAAIAGFGTLFCLTALLYKGYKNRPFLKYIPSLLVFLLSFCGILAGTFWMKEGDGNYLSFWSTAINLSSLMNIILSVFLDLLTRTNEA